LRTIRITVAYDGTRYVGWQRQARGTSVQAVIEAALSRIEGRQVVVTGSGRTDAGVHALGQVASFALEHPIATAALVRALNAVLPSDLRVLEAGEAPAGFNARFSAGRKTYRYRILRGAVADPFERRYAWHLPMSLDLATMREGLGHLLGRHDFASFQASGSRVSSTVRTLLDARLETSRRLFAPEPGPAAGDVLAVELTADGFLRHMARTIVGTVVEIGAGRRDAASVPALLAARDRRMAGPTAPAAGLFLARVEYDEPASGR
jgi:tRNA pseudouridine38-40 synthase